MKATIKILSFILAVSFFSSCTSNTTEETKSSVEDVKKPSVLAPDFKSVLAYEKIKEQLDFGVRLPNTLGHKKCGDWIVETMRSYGLEVIEQEFEAYSFKGTSLDARNIIASYNPTAKKRVLLAAHWDTREVADQDDERKNEPILGANDGASGVAILLQIAETIAQSADKPNIGIDYIFFDAEDGGKPESFEGNALNDYGGYLMGSDYWAKNPHIENYTAFYGVLLDMVGAKGATFYKDKISMRVAPSVVNKIWNVASAKGYSSFFLSAIGGDILDDHIPVIQHRNIPMIDIIDQKLGGNQTFFDHWHTHDDNLDAIDVNTLEAVGETMIQTLYEENGVIQ
ncbi:M28 family peptidase [uncultured Arcticibacterium sp.]|uniref:M28 family peptidase n=1 Tax=uncultured Arcticibacterium sp. TaxID=2173042 RepID=UPI0030FBF1BD